MKIVELSVSRSVRVNLGNYEGTEVFVSMKAETEDGNYKAAYKELRGVVDRAVTDQVARHLKARGKRADLAEVRRKYGLGE